MQKQSISDQICKTLSLPRVKVRIDKRLRGDSGHYGKDVVLSSYASISTLLHELAHHLHHCRFQRRVKGYFKTEKCPSMKPCPEHPGFYAAIGPLELVYTVNDIHGGDFKRCYIDIRAVYSKAKGR